jgi:hypothetical protein
MNTGIPGIYRAGNFFARWLDTIFYPMTPPPASAETPPGALDLIDTARAAAKRAAHACHDPQAREHFEYALALIGESWIAEDGQQARSPARVIADVRSALALFAAISAKPSHPVDPQTADR